ncbi:MAG: hypothetical protein AAGL24_09895 [Pseudomonadota bacterium]
MAWRSGHWNAKSRLSPLVVGSALDRANEAEKGRTRHPTKGYRKISARRSRAGLITAELKQGISWSTAQIAADLSAARAHDHPKTQKALA